MIYFFIFFLFTLIFNFGLLFLAIPKFFASHRKLFAVFMLVVLILARVILSGDANIFSNVAGPFFMLNDYASDPHPIFRLFPLMLSSTIFGVSDFGYRAAAFSAYLLFLLFVFTKLNDQVGWRLAFAAAAAIATLPILWHVSYLNNDQIFELLNWDAEKYRQFLVV